MRRKRDIGVKCDWKRSYGWSSRDCGSLEIEDGSIIGAQRDSSGKIVLSRQIVWAPPQASR